MSHGTNIRRQPIQGGHRSSTQDTSRQAKLHTQARRTRGLFLCYDKDVRPRHAQTFLELPRETTSHPYKSLWGPRHVTKINHGVFLRQTIRNKRVGTYLHIYIYIYRERERNRRETERQRRRERGRDRGREGECVDIEEPYTFKSTLYKTKVTSML